MTFTLQMSLTLLKKMNPKNKKTISEKSTLDYIIQFTASEEILE